MVFDYDRGEGDRVVLAGLARGLEMRVLALTLYASLEELEGKCFDVFRRTRRALKLAATNTAYLGDDKFTEQRDFSSRVTAGDSLCIVDVRSSEGE